MPSSGMKSSTSSSFTETANSGGSFSEGLEGASSIFTTTSAWLSVSEMGISKTRGLVYTWSKRISSLMASSLADGVPRDGEGGAGKELGPSG